MTPRRPWIATALIAVALSPLAACAAWQSEAVPDAAAVAGYEMFAAKDRNGDGSLSEAEFARGLRLAPAAETRRMFTLLDRDHDGRVGLAEYYPDPAAVQAFGFVEHHAGQPEPAADPGLRLIDPSRD